jgi:hypothetical protein
LSGYESIFMVVLTKRQAHVAQALVVVALEYPRRAWVVGELNDAALAGTSSGADVAAIG